MNKDLEKLEKSIKQSLSDGEAVLALDRLHTFTVKKIRSYCAIHEIDVIDEKGKGYPLHSLVGMLIKYYIEKKLISKFTEQSLKQTISIYEQFNDIRNNKSYAHDNRVLSNEESLYVVNGIVNMLNFLNYIETGESQLMSSDIVNQEDIYKFVCLNFAVTTKEISNKFNISVDDTREALMELFKVYDLIKPAFTISNPNEDNCQWCKKL